MKTIEKGDKLIIFGPNQQRVDVIITDIVIYKTFDEMFKEEGLDNVLPEIGTVEKGIAVYRQWYSSDAEKEFGVRAIKLKLDKTQNKFQDQDAGYYQKYLKYKTKYLNLKNKY